MEHRLDREIAQWVHHEGSTRRHIAPWANALTIELCRTKGFWAHSKRITVVLSKYDTSVTEIMADAVLYCDLVMLFIFLGEGFIHISSAWMKTTKLTDVITTTMTAGAVGRAGYVHLFRIPDIISITVIRECTSSSSHIFCWHIFMGRFEFTKPVFRVAVLLWLISRQFT